MTGKVQRVADRVLAVETKWLDIAFSVTVFLFTALLLGESLGYDREAALFPLVIGSVTVLLAGTLLLVQTSSRAREAVAHVFPGELGFEDLSFDQQHPGDRLQYARVFFWLLVLTALLVTTGFVLGMLVYMVVYFRLGAGESWVRLAVYSVVIWALITGLFEVILRVPFYNGLLFA